MFKHARTSNGAFFGHMPDDKHSQASGFGDFAQLAGALAHLRDGPSSRFHIGQGHGLDGIDNKQCRFLLGDVLHNRAQVGFGNQQKFFRQNGIPCIVFVGNTIGTHLDLTFRLFTRNIQNNVIFGELHRHLQNERTFANTRVATNQHY